MTRLYLNVVQVSQLSRGEICVAVLLKVNYAVSISTKITKEQQQANS